MLSSPVDGPAKGISSWPYLKGVVEESYRLMGWDTKIGKPLRSTLRRLRLEKEIADMWGDAEAPRDREEIGS
ncbi:MAG: hypothetical protein C4530_04635 [Desulfobacteraceae bacterium]|nr:MAG: hypothetical protein C4530_04635 [Desulfobacteraceae bacterium]